MKISIKSFVYIVNINYLCFMKNEKLIQKIENLPDVLQQQVADYVDFLMERYQVGSPKTEDAPLTEEDKTELDNRYNNWKNDPSSAIPLEDAKNRLMQKYGK